MKKFCPACKLELSSDLVVCPKDATLLLFVRDADTVIEEPRTGDLVANHYVIVEKLEQDSRSITFLAKHRVLATKVKMKVLTVADAEASSAFMQSAQNSAAERDGGILDFGVTPEGLMYGIYSVD